MVETTTLVTFSGLNRPVALTDCDDLIPIIRDVLRGWDITETAGPGLATADIAIHRTDQGYVRNSSFLSKPIIYPDPVNAVCDFLVDLIKAHVADHPPMLCLHTAAVAVKEGLILFPGAYHAGKSTLSVICAASGFRLFADDVLPVDGATKTGIAPGILPRLRLPLPSGAGPAFTDLTARHGGRRSERFLYVDLDSHKLASFGAVAPIRAIILPHRLDAGETGACELVNIKGSEALKRMIEQNFSRHMPALDILDFLHDVVAEAACYELNYRTGLDAVDLIRRQFEGCM
jgi:hypothetical protein